MPALKRALIADDHSLYRQGLALLLKEHFSFQEIVEAASLDEAAAGLDRTGITSLALVDLSMPGMTGLKSLASLRVRHKDTKFAIVSATETKESVMDAIAAGLSGYIPKTLPVGEFVTAITTILDGRIYVPGLMLGQPLERTPPPRQGPGNSTMPSVPRGPLTLTARQKEVLDCVRAGMSNREIAEKLGISAGTVKVHVGALLTALKLRNRVQLVSH